MYPSLFAFNLSALGHSHGEGEILAISPPNISLSPNAIAFLECKTPDAIAHFLADLSYIEFRPLVYPHPRYRTFAIGKRNGSFRVIEAPRLRLKKIQRVLAKIFLELFGEPETSVHGFCLNRSIVTNARFHSAQANVIVNLDLQNFFSAIHFGRVRGVFLKPPFDFPSNVAAILAHICCYEKRLPQGAPTSPVISNFICRSLDAALKFQAWKAKMVYSRYCDDLTFSSNKLGLIAASPIVSKIENQWVINEHINKLVETQSFKINSEKTRASTRPQRLEVTGLTINKFPNVRRSFIDQIRGMLHSWKKYGLANAQVTLATKYRRKLGSAKTPNFENVLRGRLLFLSMVRGKEDVIYSRLAKKFNTLLATENPNCVRRVYISDRVQNVEDLSCAVFVIECSPPDNGSAEQLTQGTAFLLSGVGLITCAHVLRKGKDLYFRPEDGDVIKVFNTKSNIEFTARIVKYDEGRDLAILEPIEALPNGIKQLNLRDSAPDIGADLLLVGFPNYSPSKSITIQDSKVTSFFNQYSFPHFEINQTIRAGNSGGPVVDSEFYLTGVAKEGATQADGNNAVICAAQLKLF